jgi:hypothetical protein
MTRGRARREPPGVLHPRPAASRVQGLLQTLLLVRGFFRVQVIRAQDWDEQEVICLLHNVPGHSRQPTDIAVALGCFADYMQQVLDEPCGQCDLLRTGEGSLVADLYAVTVDDVVDPVDMTSATGESPLAPARRACPGTAPTG